jgi:hypothetical protein
VPNWTCELSTEMLTNRFAVQKTRHKDSIQGREEKFSNKYSLIDFFMWVMYL